IRRLPQPLCGMRPPLLAEASDESPLMSGDSNDYREIFLSDLPLMNVRAPIEFAKGAFPQALHRPLMDDDEHDKVVTCYKQKRTEERRFGKGGGNKSRLR